MPNDKIRGKFVCNDGSILNGKRQPIPPSFLPDERRDVRNFCHRKNTILQKTILY